MKTIKITEGFANNYLVHALGALVLAFITFNYSNVWPLFFVFISLIFFFVMSGFEIDPNNRTYRKYHIFLGFMTFGKWRQFSETDTFYLMLSSESSTVTTPILFAPTNFYNGRTSKVITFDIVLVNDDGRQILNAFTKYNSAKQALKYFHDAGCDVRNRISEKINENKKRR